MIIQPEDSGLFVGDYLWYPYRYSMRHVMALNHPTILGVHNLEPFLTRCFREISPFHIAGVSAVWLTPLRVRCKRSPFRSISTAALRQWNAEWLTSSRSMKGSEAPDGDTSGIAARCGQRRHQRRQKMQEGSQGQQKS